ncbi:ComEC family competence protein [Novipirellula galeiformis]|uniref:ComEC family competence protein n=1 Tax=Novipirellula galeiformis TaxID=2528004 RepID=A0A5C6CGP2_9BACT|nr:ComEC/Rec2 family competence protein [Novipirellula galeiformis]TWU23488.1 ComEC family competence protein [Novipirellula galeiformis]
MAAVSVAAPDREAGWHFATFWPRHPLLLLAIAAAVGIVIDAWITQPFQSRVAFWGAVALVSCVLFVLGAAARKRFAVVLAVMSLAGLWHGYNDSRYQTASILNELAAYPEPAIVEGTVDRPVVLRRNPLADSVRGRDQSPWQSVLELQLHRVRMGQRFHACDGRVMVVGGGRLDHFRPGDTVRVHGELAPIMAPNNPGENDLRPVYRRRGIHARMDVDRENQIQLREQSFVLGRVVAGMATRSRELLLRHTGASAGPLAVALVIGQRDFVDPETRDLLLVTGTAHLLSVSGLHLAIVIILASGIAILLRFPLGAKIVWVLAICCLYTAITGGRPPVMRAAVLVAMVMFSLWFKRPAQPINTLSLAALILLAINPENLFHVGVQLSFLAVATLFLCQGRAVTHSHAAGLAIENEQRIDALIESSQSATVRYARIGWMWLGRMVWFSGCVTAISIPLVWHQFHMVSLISVATNVILSPFLFFSLASGVATVVVGWALESLAAIPGFLCGFGLQRMREIIGIAAEIPYGHFWLPSPPAAWVFVFYLVMVLSLCWPQSRASSHFRYGWIAFWMGAAWIMATTHSPLESGSFEATFVDVGHGTSVVLRDDRGRVFLYDCGRLANEMGSSRDIDATLWSLGVTRLDAIFLSHADSDHYNAIPGVLRRFQVDRIITPPGMLGKQELGLRATREAIESANVPVIEVHDAVLVPELPPEFSLLHPPKRRVAGNDNANSLVLQVDVGGRALLLPGDLEPPGTEVLINKRRPPLGSVLMAPHHGSLTMDAESILQWSRPAEVIVSGGKRSRKPAVRAMLNTTGAGVYVTAEVGAVRVRIGRDGEVEVRSWKRSPW